MSSTSSQPPLAFWQGIDQFNSGDFYGCHDTLEAIWMTSALPDKSFYQGILQIAVGLYHLSNHNWRGAAILLGEGSRRLEPYEPIFHGINVTNLLDRAHDWLQALQSLGPEGVQQVAATLIPESAAAPAAPSSSLDLPPPLILAAAENG
jgi:predicted metal-dependent hydrolase